MNRSGLPPLAGGPSTSSGLGGSSLSSLSAASTSTNNAPDGRNQVTKVAEVFLTAGHAFQRLGDLTLQLQGESAENDESKWMESDITKLRDALTRFAHELDTISESVQQRTMKHIKVDIKRRTLVGDDTVRRVPAVQGMLGGGGGGMQMSGGGGGGGPMVAQKRGAHHLMTMPGGSGLSQPKRMNTTTQFTKFQPYTNTMAAAGRLSAASRPPTSYLTESSLSGGGAPSLSSSHTSSHSAHSTPLLNEPSHHYISSRSGTNY